MRYVYNRTIGVVLFFLVFLIGGITVCYGQTVSAGSVNTPSGYSIDLTTGNMIQYDSSLKTNNGWALSGMTGSFTNDGYTFSYALGTVEQTVNLAGIPISYQNSSAVFITGLSYGFKYRFPCANSIGGSCENTSGPQDTLNSTFTYYNKDGSVGYSQYYGLGSKNISDGNSAYNPNWQTLADTYTFTGAKTLATVGSAKLSISGMDAGFWACLMPDCYGPQVKDAYLNVNYSVDPCILNPAYNPSCAGFNAVIQYGQSPMFTGNYNIPTSLPHIGGGVQLHGYEYGVGYYAGDYCTNTFLFWCTSSSGANGRNVSLNITNMSGTSLISDSWWVEGNYSGGSRYGRALFTESQNSLNMGYVNWSVWGGYGNNMGIYTWTRPIWTPDPCYTQPLYSPNCSNFNAEIKRLADEQNKIQKITLDNTVASVSSKTTTPTNTITTTVDDPHSTSPKVTTITTELPPPPPGSSPPLPGSSPPSPGLSPPPPGSASPSPGSSPPPGSNPSPGTPSPPVQETTTVKSSGRPDASVSSDSTNFALSLVSKNQERETNIAMQASQQAISEAQNVGIQSLQQAQRIGLEMADRSSQKSIEDMNRGTSQSNMAEFKPQTQQVNSIALFAAPQQTSILSLQQGMNNTQQTNNFTVMSVSQQNQITISLVAPPQVIQSVDISPSMMPLMQQQSVQTIQSVDVSSVMPSLMQQQSVQTSLAPIEQTQSFKLEAKDTTLSQPNFITDRTNAINQLIENKTNLTQTEQQQTQTQQVKSNVQDNDLAAGVSITNIARTPVGFNSYMIALTDTSFYTPKEIYRNQKNIDNARALRQLASDKLHQQMVDQQYLPR